jgi:acetyl esterase/lipase
MKNTKKILLIISLSVFCAKCFAQEEILLYPNGAAESNDLEEEVAPNSEFKRNISTARLFAYIAPKEKATGAAVIICPGGGYSGIAFVHEGNEFAKWLNDRRISAFVLHYRMPNSHYEIPLKDAQTALELVYRNAKKWNIARAKIGIAGFSAGGHLAAIAGTRFTTKKNRPNFMILVYPVITMDKVLTHRGSLENLLGKNPPENLVKRFSCELNVTKKTPKTFLIAAEDDNVVPIKNSLLFYEALQAKKTPATLKIYQKGGHGFGLRKQGTDADNWTNELQNWLVLNKLGK